MRRLLLALSLMLCSFGAFAQLYSWKDAAGKVHYSDEPPPEKTQARKVAAPPIPPTEPATVRRTFLEKEALSRKQQKEAQEAAQKQEQAGMDAAERRAECERAQGNLKAIESGQTRFVTNSAGEKVGLDGAVREAELDKARKMVDAWCK